MDRFKHDDGEKAQDISLRGKRLVRNRKGRAGHEAAKLANKGYVDRDKRGLVTKRNQKIEEAARDMATAPKQTGVSGYLKNKKDTLKELDEVFK